MVIFLNNPNMLGIQDLGEVLMDYRIRSGKSLSLGMPMAPQDIQG